MHAADSRSAELMVALIANLLPAVALFATSFWSFFPDQSRVPMNGRVPSIPTHHGHPPPPPPSPPIFYSGYVDFIHVGKTGGDSVQAVLTTGAKLANFKLRVFHVKAPYNDTAAVPRPTAILVSVRDPISRLVSAFNWRDPDEGGKVNHRPSENNTNAKATEVDLYTQRGGGGCFNSVNEFAEALWDRSWCGLVARRNLLEPIAHLGMGIAFYTHSSVADLVAMGAPIHLAHTPSLAADLACFFRRVWPHQADHVPPLPNIHTKYKKQNDTYLSPRARSILENMLATEYYLLSELERVAVRC